MAIRLHTIGFAGKSAEQFFDALRRAGVQKLIDVRRSNNTLYCGFTRARDLPFFLTHLCGIAYVHEPDFAPSLELLKDYQKRIEADRKDPQAWPEYVDRFLAEIAQRPICERFQGHAAGFSAVALLCTESKPDRCHRRLLAEHLKNNCGDCTIEIVHL